MVDDNLLALSSIALNSKEKEIDEYDFKCDEIPDQSEYMYDAR